MGSTSTADEGGISRAVLWEIADGEETVEDLIAAVESFDLPSGLESSLSAPLGQAATLLGDANPNNDAAACGKLGAFINQVNAAANRGQLTPAQASELVQAAEAVGVTLAC